MGMCHARGLVGCVLCLLACGESTSRRAEPTTPTRGTYPGRCELVAIEYTDVERRSDTEPEPGAVLLVASYRPSDEPSRPAFDVRFRVEQRSADALRAHLEGHPIVACSPAAGDELGSVDVPPVPSSEPTP